LPVQWLQLGKHFCCVAGICKCNMRTRHCVIATQLTVHIAQRQRPAAAALARRRPSCPVYRA
jgi:hypothetical protein